MTTKCNTFTNNNARLFQPGVVLTIDNHRYFLLYYYLLYSRFYFFLCSLICYNYNVVIYSPCKPLKIRSRNIYTACGTLILISLFFHFPDKPAHARINLKRCFTYWFGHHKSNCPIRLFPRCRIRVRIDNNRRLSHYFKRVCRRRCCSLNCCRSIHKRLRLSLCRSLCLR